MAGILSDKVAVVTGGASGIGLASVEALHDAGASVVIVDRDAEMLTTHAERLGDRVHTQITDLIDRESCATMIPDLLSKTPKIDILLCNAGSYVGGDLVDTDPLQVDRMLNLNINAVIRNVYDVIPHMRERGTGDILVTCSVAGHAAIPWEPVYSASKWAMTSFVQIMRRQLAPLGIRVGQVSPGPVVSSLLSDWPEENLKKALANGSLIDPTEVAEAIVFMLTRPRNVTIRDMIVLPTAFDI